MPRKSDFRRMRKLEKKKRKKKLKDKKRKRGRAQQNKLENIKGQVVESINPTFNRSSFVESPNNITKQSDVLKKPTSKVFDKSAWKPSDGQEKQ